MGNYRHAALLRSLYIPDSLVLPAPYWAPARPGAACAVAAIDIFGGEIVPFPKPPRPLAERYFTIASWDEHDRGGHFPAVAEPSLLAQRLRDTLRPFRPPAQPGSRRHGADAGGVVPDS